MRAVVMRRFGGPDVLETAELPEPVPGPGESVIDVTLAGVNYGDLEVRAGIYRPPRLPAVPGAEVVGRRRRDGRRVAALLRDGGGYAEVAVARDAYTVELPDDLDDRTAAALVEQGCTAYAALVTAGRLRPGERVAVASAAGGVGHLAVQLARALGASVVAGTASSPAKRDFVRRTGADHAVGGPEELPDVLPDGVDLYLDSLGGPRIDAALAALAPFGRIVSIGHREEPAVVAVDALTRRSLGVVTLWMQQVLEAPGLFADVAERVLALAREGRLVPHVDRVVPLDGTARAHEAVAARETTGKVLIDLLRRG
ncbi:zinc-binding dehydrogenase [Streptomyces sp. I05A-00742]|uniref:quinone oxidoreductase family protein n=1 Tax=Streptomyces sp. I05A-00742 TaxID=2732853 RepID=UPI0014879535|nr:zinc-binding dehydrogenase [Streptomyces sp. I05A-00742]